MSSWPQSTLGCIVQRKAALNTILVPSWGLGLIPDALLTHSHDFLISQNKTFIKNSDKAVNNASGHAVFSPCYDNITLEDNTAQLPLQLLN